MPSLWRILCALVLLTVSSAAFADPAPFDLVGPKLAVRVTHAGVTLPISQTPNLSPGDQLSIRAELPPGESVHYLLVAAFLRGATNPPPEKWFYRTETWAKPGSDGLKLTVPTGAEQVLVFLAPQTGGDFKTLVNAVRGRPGAFVRASQDLNQASLERSRLDTFLASIRRINQADPEQLKTASPLLARSLTIKLNADCLQRSPELQAPCLMQGQDALVLNDGHSNSLVASLTSGDTADLIQELSVTPQAQYGYFSPYIGAVMDMARIMDSIHTAQYQYIPALATAQGDELSLILNTPPSFHDPQSVLVATLPAVAAPQPPPLQPVDPKAAYCSAKPSLVLPVEGAPLVFSTDYAHDMVLRMTTKAGKTVDAPVKADAALGGFVADTTTVSADDLRDGVDGYLHGVWGFSAFDGPKFRLQVAHTQPWTLTDEDQQSLIVGRSDVVHLKAPGAACVDSVTLKLATGEVQKVDWTANQPDELAVTAPLTDAQPGPLTLLIKQYGAGEAQAVPLQAYAQAGRLEHFTFHAGDDTGSLQGARLDEVTGLTLRGVAFKPGKLTSTGAADELSLTAADAAAAAKLKNGENATAKIALADGRTINLKVSVAPPRPSVTLIDKSVQPDGAAAAAATIRLTDKDEIPQGAILTFSIHAQSPAKFSDHEKIEVADADGMVLATLGYANGLVLEDAHVALATLDTGKTLGDSAFGPLQFRVVDDGGAGDWRPLAILVRLPTVHHLKCGVGPGQACMLSGANLFLIDSLSGDPAFDHAVRVPEGFTGAALPAPRPVAGKLYVKLRDDPAASNVVAISAGGQGEAPQTTTKPAARAPGISLQP